MFDQTFVDGVQKTKKKYTIVLSLLIEVLALGVLVLIPLLYTQVLPTAQLKSLLMAPAPPRAPIPELVNAAKTPLKRVRQLNASLLIVPRVVPKTVATNVVVDSPEIVVPRGTGDPNGPMNNVPVGIFDSTSGTGVPPQPPPPAVKPTLPKGPVPVGGNVAAANLIRRVNPAYPPLAKSARVQGSVEFTAIISRTGDIENLQLVHGHPLLVTAAREAVLQWKYRPTLLNGQPVEVITDITVNFTLSN
jgi:periplasmic protein TonB